MTDKEPPKVELAIDALFAPEAPRKTTPTPVRKITAEPHPTQYDPEQTRHLLQALKTSTPAGGPRGGLDDRGPRGR